MTTESPEYLYNCFIKALEFEASRKGYGFKSFLATATATSNAYITQIFKREKTASFRKQIQISQSLAHTFEEFLRLGRSLMETGRPPAPLPSPEQPLVVQINSRTDTKCSRDITENYRGIPLYESGKLAAGVNGVEFDPHEEPASTVVVYEPELRGCSRHNLAALRAGGYSMEPTISKGSIVVVDLDDRNFLNRKVFCVNYAQGGDNIAAIKRVQQWKSGFILVSDNPTDFPPEVTDLDWDSLCVGRVVWMWRDIRNI